MPFADLGDDILLNVLALCDVYRVLTVSAIDKRLRGLTQAKQLWLSLIQDSTFRNILELRPSSREELECLSTRELVDLVKHAVIGPPQWWPGGPSSSRTPAYTITCETGVEHFWGSYVLLPGARYIVFGSHSTEDLCMFDIWNGRRVWTFAKENNHTCCAIDLVPGGATARVVVAVAGEYVGRGYYIHVEEIDLTTGASHEVFRLGFATQLHSISAIVGDFFLYSPVSSITPFSDVKSVLVNWRESTYVVLNYGTPTNSAAILIPGHIVATHPYTRAPYHQLLTVTALESFAPYWMPLTGITLSDQLLPKTIPITARERQEYHGVPLGDSKHTHVTLSITPNAVYEGAYTIVTHTGEFPKPSTITAQVGALFTGKRLADSGRAVQLTYSLRPPLAPGQASALRLVSAQLATPGMGSGGRIPPRAVVAQSRGSFTVSYYQ
ncbi:hypothetical protein MSAN_02013700 [Mycena sanguinolenta]|uniref:F-box domain-containing protein n=1 Tax=Mycena sanguinolenta TaxID=230812 RepID=A0A8H6XK91_9AGAR|nr:hypothetical protein MSAN_02013700 [Mycena sanguinolenta]